MNYFPFSLLLSIIYSFPLWLDRICFSRSPRDTCYNWIIELFPTSFWLPGLLDLCPILAASSRRNDLFLGFMIDKGDSGSTVRRSTLHNPHQEYPCDGRLLGNQTTNTKGMQTLPVVWPASPRPPMCHANSVLNFAYTFLPGPGLNGCSCRGAIIGPSNLRRQNYCRTMHKRAKYGIWWPPERFSTLVSRICRQIGRFRGDRIRDTTTVKIFS